MFKKIIDNFSLELDALRDFVKIREKISHEIKKTMKDNPEAFLPRAIFFLEKEKATCKDPKELKEIEKRLISLKKISTRFFKHELDKKGKIVKFSAINENTIEKSLAAFDTFQRKIAGNHYILRSCLINMASIFENLLKEIILIVDKKQPISDKLEDESITFAELKCIGNIENARKILLENYIEKCFYRSQKERIQLVQRLTKTNFSIDTYEDEFTEINERRNIYTHNDGVVNRRYLSSVNASLIKKHGAELNEHLSLTDEYILQSLDIIEAIGIHIATKVWQNIEPNCSERPEFIHHFVGYNSLIKKKYFVTEHCSQDVMRDSAAKPIFRDMAQLNYWLAVKKQGRFEEIKNDVMQEDFSSRLRILQLGLLALQENKDDFFKLLKDLLQNKNDEFSLKEYEEFPIFEEMRNSKESKDLFVSKK